jgi:uncharacterized protein
VQINEITYDDAVPIDGYGPGFFRIGGQVLRGAILVTPGGARNWGGYGDLASLIAVAGDIDVLFVGTGAEIAHLPVAFREALEDAGLGVEAMSSPAACRTYNVLVSEGRRIGLALFAL